MNEHAVLKAEQLERIKLRDTFLNLNIVALAVVTAIAVQGQRQSAAWLVVPWLTAILGWAYLSNDDKVTAIARHIKGTLNEMSAEFSWEAGPKGVLPPWTRRIADVVVFVLSFLLPAPIAVVLYAVGYAVSWPGVVVVIVTVELVVTAGLGAVYVLSLVRRA